MCATRRITGNLLALLLVFTGQVHAQLALTHGGLALAPSGGGGSSPGGAITVEVIGAGTAAFGSATSISAPYSAIGTISSGQKLLALNLLRTAAGDTPSDPTDFASGLIYSYNAGGGTHGSNVGPRRLTAWERTASGSESGSVTSSWSTSSGVAAATQLVRLSGANAGWQATAYAYGANDSGTSVGATASTTVDLLPNDLVIALLGVSSGDGGVSSATITGTGVTMGSTTSNGTFNVAAGSGGQITVIYASVSSGSSATSTLDVVANWTEGFPPSTVLFIRVRNNP